MKNQICALVVTYNRTQLLIDCLNAIKNQTYPVNAIIILDNFSNEETLVSAKNNGYLPTYSAEFLNNGGELVASIYTSSGREIIIYYKRLSQNTGGAGGFNAGMRFFYQKTDLDKLWMMDDDCKPLNNALEKLIQSYDYLGTKYINKLGFICSRVLWADGTLCKMANPSVKSNNGFEDFTIDSHVLEVETAAFVSIILPRHVIEKVGLPIKEYFIWNDDLEYTYRVNKLYKSFLSLDSIVIHQTPINLSSEFNINQANLFKQQFGIRNKIAWLRGNRGILRAIYFSCKFLKLITIANLSIWDKLVLCKSVFNGWFFAPKIEKIIKNNV